MNLVKVFDEVGMRVTVYALSALEDRRVRLALGGICVGVVGYASLAGHRAMADDAFVNAGARFSESSRRWAKATAAIPFGLGAAGFGVGASRFGEERVKGGILGAFVGAAGGAGVNMIYNSFPG